MLQTATSQRQAAIDECRRCQDACLDTVTHALRQGGAYADEAVVGALLDVVDVCRTSIEFLRRGSALRTRTCAVAAEICERAAEACEAFVHDPVMLACAAVCRRCAAMGREISEEWTLPRTA